jgi:hypothetical protein
VFRFIEEVVFTGIGRGVLRVLSPGRLQPARHDRRPSWVGFLGALGGVGVSGLTSAEDQIVTDFIAASVLTGS